MSSLFERVSMACPVLRDLVPMLKRANNNCLKYTFSVRQVGTNDPTILVSQDDFNLATPITFIRGAEGTYIGDISPLGLTPGPNVNLFVSSAKTPSDDISVFMSSGSQMQILTKLAADGTYVDGITDQVGLVISIQKTLS